jgi:hypothetical protein
MIIAMVVLHRSRVTRLHLGYHVSRHWARLPG